ncbi:MAG TPA: tetratricopeptide repeat protein [Humisphaera sp.]
MPEQPLPEIDSLWDYAHPAASEAAFRTVLERPEAADPQRITYRLEVLTQVARAQGLQRLYDDCHVTLDAVERELPTDDHYGGRQRVRARLLLERGRAFRDAGRPDEAKRCFREVVEVADASRSHDGLSVDAMHMLGIMDPPAEAAEWNERALEVVKRSDDKAVRRWYGSLMNNQGWTLHKLGRYRDALPLFQMIAHVFEVEGRFERARIAKYAVAKTLRMLGQFDKALAMQQAVAVESKEPDGYVHEELAECLLALGRGEEAREHFRTAHGLLSADPWFPTDEAARLERMKALAEGAAS